MTVVPFPYREVYAKRKGRGKGFDPSWNTLSVEDIVAIYDDNLEVVLDYRLGVDPYITPAESLEALVVMKQVERCLNHRKIPYTIGEGSTLNVQGY